MTSRDPARAAPALPRRRGLSIRVKLTLSYATFLVVAGTLLGAVLILVLRYVPDENLVMATGPVPGGFAPNRSDLLEAAVPLVATGIALLALLGTVGGWVLAGRVLRPLDALSRAVRAAGAGDLAHRIHLPGPSDELRELADEVDDMLARLERAFVEQQRFTANASHELRTPAAAMRTILEVARADPAARDVDALLGRLAELNDRSTRTLDALLQLAHADQVAVRREPLDLVEVAEDALEHLAGDLDVRVALPDTPVHVLGDRALLDQLAANLVRNAVVHNVPDGGVVWVEVRREEDGGPVLRVANTGPVLDPAVVATLTEPFVRGAGRTRTAREAGGSGLGLAVAASIALAHRADLRLSPRDGGGLDVTLRFGRPRREP